ncbi:MAG: hypothetical protein IT280_09670 [Ignavibacteria bacterium]|nr:hypothetical protein [Ignavibacteria bacterium]
MKKFLIAAFLSIAVFALNENSTNSQALYFFVTNNTGVTLNNIYVTPNETTNWGTDILPNDLFENGSSVRVDIPADYGATCLFDMKITDLEGNYITFTGMDACKLHTLILNADGTYSATE